MDDYVERFQRLRVYMLSRELALDIFHLTKTFPKEERYSMTDQIRRSSRSVGAQIAEAWGKRGYEKHFASKMTDADAEQLETQHWVELAYDCGYLTETDFTTLLTKCENIGRMINGTIAKAYKFCKREY